VRWGGFIAACAAVCLATAAVRAADPDPAAAEALFRRGRELADAGDWTHACPLFAESNRLDLALGTSMNLAACEEHIGKLASAWERYRGLLEALPPNDDRRTFVAESATRLERVVPKLTVLPAVPPAAGATLTRDGIDLGGASVGVALPVDPGEHSIVVAAPRHAARRYVVTLSPGQQLTLHTDVGEPIIEAAPAGGPRRTGARTAGWIVGAVGVGAVAVGSVLGILALSKRSASDSLCTMGVCRDQAALDDYDVAKSAALAADIALAVGVVSVAVGGYLLFTSSAKAQPPLAANSLGSFRVSGVGFSW
jgi:hypothetical protein